MPPIVVLWFVTLAGRLPVRTLLDELELRDPVAYEELYALIASLAAYGGEIPSGSKSLGRGLYELRSTAGRSQYRIVFFMHRRGAVLLSAFEKKARRTPHRELELARKRRRQVEADPDVHASE